MTTEFDTTRADEDALDSEAELQNELEDEDEDEGMTDQEFQDALYVAVESSDDLDDVRVSTFADAGIMTYNKGLVVSIGESEWQVSIVRSA
jgi:hypothetical protein